MSPLLIEELDVKLVAQPNSMSGWAAALAMLLSFRDSMDFPVEKVANAVGMSIEGRYSWPCITRAVAAWGLCEKPSPSHLFEWLQLLRCHGPIWLVDRGTPEHSVVIKGMFGLGTAENTLVALCNPTPTGQGILEYKTFMELTHEFGIGIYGRATNAAIVCAKAQRHKG